MKNRNRFGRLRAMQERHSDQRLDRALARMGAALDEIPEHVVRPRPRPRPRRGFWPRFVDALTGRW